MSLSRLQPFLNVKEPGLRAAMTASNTHANALNHRLPDLAR